MQDTSHTRDIVYKRHHIQDTSYTRDIIYNIHHIRYTSYTRDIICKRHHIQDGHLKISASPETSSENGEIEIAGDDDVHETSHTRDVDVLGGASKSAPVICRTTAISTYDFFEDVSGQSDIFEDPTISPMISTSPFCEDVSGETLICYIRGLKAAVPTSNSFEDASSETLTFEHNY